MFYYKKRNTPQEDDLILYPSMEALMRYEGISKNTYMYERKTWLIQTVYSIVENKKQFKRYSKWYIRFTDYTKANIVAEKLKKRVIKNS
jgi:hypothetical protein